MLTNRAGKRSDNQGCNNNRLNLKELYSYLLALPGIASFYAGSSIKKEKKWVIVSRV